MKINFCQKNKFFSNQNLLSANLELFTLFSSEISFKFLLFNFLEICSQNRIIFFVFKLVEFFSFINDFLLELFSYLNRFELSFESRNNIFIII